ncbi:uncharacterized protein LOC126951540 [Macaca thibetana thibetana]|uniref:uncharacterized protein LOC126951540 n=1 Tax=Macaca thibetana thibetana TaxID=257877 RepID=UPI0021BCAFCA|nr:uncharacterized protein LOC126951540 [Macaca thibetana thibetana]
MSLGKAGFPLLLAALAMGSSLSCLGLTLQGLLTLQGPSIPSAFQCQPRPPVSPFSGPPGGIPPHPLPPLSSAPRDISRGTSLLGSRPHSCGRPARCPTRTPAVPVHPPGHPGTFLTACCLHCVEGQRLNEEAWNSGLMDMAACPPPTPAQPFFTQRLKRGERNLLGPGNTPLLRHSLHYSLASSVGNSLPVGGSAADTCKLHTPGWRFQTFMRPVTYCAQGLPSNMSSHPF